MKDLIPYAAELLAVTGAQIELSYNGISAEIPLIVLSEINNIFDAVGLGVFTVSGMNTAMGVSDNVILILTLGVITGVGGGMLRDMMINKMPKVLRKHVYAVASLSGGILYYVLHIVGVNDILSAVIGMVFIFAVRVLATAYKWNLPSVKFD